MNWTVLLRESLIIGAVLSGILSIMVLVSLKVNKEIWLNDYPPDVKAKWGPMSQKAKRQRVWFVIPFFALLVGAMAFAVARLEVILGTLPSFMAIFISIALIFGLFNLVDAVIIDWLILMILWPELGVLPGTEGMAGYRDTRLWTLNLLKGFALTPLVGILVAGITFLFLR